MILPAVEWPRVAGRIQRHWRPAQVNPHHVAYAMSRAGKDHLWRYGVLPTKPAARALVFDVKQGGDERWDAWGADIALGDWRPTMTHQRTRLRVPLGDHGARLTRRALEALLIVGETVVILPDAGRITEPPGRGGLNCEGLVTRMMAEGASHGITVLAGINSTVWASSGLKHQAGHVWLGQTIHADMRSAFADAAGLPKTARPVLDTLPPHHFVYADYLDGAPMLAVTKAPPARATPQTAQPEVNP